MKNRQRGVDARLLRSCLDPLQRQLDAQLQAARYSLGVRQLEAASVADQVRELREDEAAALAEAAAIPGHSFDAALHRHVLRHLVALAQLRGARESASQAAEGRMSDARTQCVERDRKLAVVQRLQEQELRAQAALAMRRQGREADLDWLARTQGKARR